MGLPPSPAVVMAQLGFEDAAVLDFSIYTFFISLNPTPSCTFPLHSPFHLLLSLS